MDAKELLEKVNGLTKMIAYKMSKSGNGENVEYVQLSQVVSLVSSALSAQAAEVERLNADNAEMTAALAMVQDYPACGCALCSAARKAQASLALPAQEPAP